MSQHFLAALFSKRKIILKTVYYELEGNEIGTEEAIMLFFVS